MNMHTFLAEGCFNIERNVLFEIYSCSPVAVTQEEKEFFKSVQVNASHVVIIFLPLYFLNAVPCFFKTMTFIMNLYSMNVNYYVTK